MNVLIYGNTNNYLLLLAEGLRALGHEATLIINRTELLHRPEGIDSQYSRYPEWILDWSHVTYEDLMYGSRFVEQSLAELSEVSDFALLNDTGPSLHQNIACPFAVLATGSDVTWYANRASQASYFSKSATRFLYSARGKAQRKKFRAFVERQRQGIRKAGLVFSPPHAIAPELSAILDNIGVPRRRRHFLYLADTHRLSPEPVPAGAILKILCGARVTMAASDSDNIASQDDKGTAILLAGIKKFCEQGHSADLHMPEKGSDVEETKELIHELDLTSVVTWYKEASHAEFYAKIKSAHVIVDSVGRSFPGLCYTAAIASGRCVLANLYPNKIPFDLPGLHADRPEEVAAGLIKLDNDRQYLQAISTASGYFAESQLSPKKQAQDVLRLLQPALKRRKSLKAVYKWGGEWLKRFQKIKW